MTQSRRAFISMASAIPAFTLFSTIRRANSEPAHRPNIVFFMADDLGYRDIGCYGCKDTRTPAIDRLSDEGIRFTQYYANAPECTPTRAALLTGRYPQRLGGLECAIGTGNVGRYDDAIRLRETHELGLPADIPTLPAWMKSAGYQTALIGKWHLGYEPHFNPLHYGFDTFFGPLGGGIDYFHHTESDGTPVLYRDRQPIRKEGYITDLITDEAVAFIRRSQTPFFLEVAYTAPHTPYQGPDDYRDQPRTEDEWNKGNRQTYIEMVECMDRGIDKILQTLDDLDLTQNTLVVFASDNGGTSLADNGPFRQGKGTTFEGGIRVPCVARWPGTIPPKTVSDQIALTMDWTASMAQAAGAPLPSGRPLDGIDILTNIKQERPAVSRTAFWRLRRGDRTWRAARNGPMKYVSLQEGNKLEEYLFDLSNDPGERENLVDRDIDALKRLTTHLNRWETEVKPAR